MGCMGYTFYYTYKEVDIGCEKLLHGYQCLQLKRSLCWRDFSFLGFK
jgi:hypothetical protein